MKFLFVTEYGELLDWALALQDEGHEVLLYIKDKGYRAIGKGMVEHIDDWHPFIGRHYTWVFEGCGSGETQDWLRKRGEKVFGGSAAGDELENDRQVGQKLFKAAGFTLAPSHNFKGDGAFDEAMNYVARHTDKRHIMKQNGAAPKTLNHMGRFSDGADMLYHLDAMKSRWKSEWGQPDFDIMEAVEGTEVAASAFFNGHDWMRDERGRVVGFLNHEEKKANYGDMGESCGETGTTFLAVDETNKLFADILLKPEIEEALEEARFYGVFDINGMMTDDGYVPFEVTCRPGTPSTSYETITALDMPLGELVEAVAGGKDTPIAIKPGVGMVIVLTAKPFPLESEADIADAATSLGEKLWFKDNNEESVDLDDLDEEIVRRIHFYNFECNDDGDYLCASKSGYLLVVSGCGDTVQEARERCFDVLDHLHFPSKVFRTDIGKKVEAFVENQKENKKLSLLPRKKREPKLFIRR